jgi:hypothetical protein
MTKVQPSERCTARDAFDRFSKIRESLSDDELASSVPKAPLFFTEDADKCRISAFEQFKAAQ